MTANRIQVLYGKANAFVASAYVVENAVEAYKKMWTEIIRSRGWKKEISFRELKGKETLDENGGGEINAFTKSGYYEVVRVK